MFVQGILPASLSRISCDFGVAVRGTGRGLTDLYCCGRRRAKSCGIRRKNEVM
jgi:hypothetical protein